MLTAMDDAILSRVLGEIESRQINPTLDILHASVATQELRHYREGELYRIYSISTGKKPPSCIENSHGTPSGLHCVADKIGAGAPSGMVFKARQAVGRHYSEMEASEQARNLVTTRIMRLRGLEPGHNSGAGCDTFDRFIYIHGTNHEDHIGTPDTHGCLAMRNEEVIQLFEEVPEGTLLWIDVA